MTRLIGMSVLLVAILLAGFPTATADVHASPISIAHTPPEAVVPGTQIDLSAVLSNATAAKVSWRNSTMAEDGLVPMTNLSESKDGGWVYAAWLPAQDSPTQIRYTINASSAAGYRAESYFFSVDYPVASGITEAQQQGWILTMVASLSMAISVVAMLYWYTGLRLRREGR